MQLNIILFRQLDLISCIEKIREQIFSSFHNSDSELFKIIPENINSMGELDSKPYRTLEVIDSSNKINVRHNFQKLDSATLELIIKDLESESLSIAEMSRKYSCAKSKLYNIRKQKHYYLN